MLKQLPIDNFSFVATGSNGLSDLQMLVITSLTVVLATMAILAITSLGITLKENTRLTNLIVEHNNTQHEGNGN